MITAGTAGSPTSESAEPRDAARPAVTATSWAAHGSMEISEWTAHGRRLGVMGRGVGWWLGDWLRFGNAAYGERYGPAARLTGYDRQSLMNMVYVASRFERSRRRENLSWSHHAEIAAHEPTDQDRWLDRVERDRLSVRDLREAIRTERRGAEADQPAEGDAEPAMTAPHDPPDVVCPSCGRPLASNERAGD